MHLSAVTIMASLEVHGRTASEIAQHCDLCAEGDENIPAEAYCTVCNEFMCTQCATSHQRSRLGRNHKLVDKDSMPRKQSEKDQEYVNEYCKDHPRELVKYFCPTHGDLLCGDCVVKNSHTCKLQVIAEVSKGYRKSTEFKQHEEQLKKITDKISKTKHNIDSKTVSVEDSKSQSVKQVRTFQAELINAINKMSDEITTDIETKAQTTLALISNLKTTSKSGELKVLSMANVIENCKENDVFLFIATHRTKEIVTNVSKQIDEAENALTSVPQYSFTENDKVKSLLQKTTNIGLYEQMLKSGVNTNQHGK